MSKAVVKCERTEMLKQTCNEIVNLLHTIATLPEKKTISLTKKKLPTS